MKYKLIATNSRAQSHKLFLRLSLAALHGCDINLTNVFSSLSKNWGFFSIQLNIGEEFSTNINYFSAVIASARFLLRNLYTECPPQKRLPFEVKR